MFPAVIKDLSNGKLKVNLKVTGTKTRVKYGKENHKFNMLRVLVNQTGRLVQEMVTCYQ